MLLKAYSSKDRYTRHSQALQVQTEGPMFTVPAADFLGSNTEHFQQHGLRLGKTWLTSSA